MIKQLILVMLFLASGFSFADDSDDHELEDFLNGMKPITDEDFHYNGNPKEEVFVLGKALFYDKILSGNLNISCAACHSPFAGRGDGLSLPTGEGASGISTSRNLGLGADAIHMRVRRHATHLFNKGAKEYDSITRDGHIRLDPNDPTGFNTPLPRFGIQLPYNLDTLLAVQAMLPIVNLNEMAGQKGENQQAELAIAFDLYGLWEFMASKLRAIPEYVDMFKAAFPHITRAEDITYVHAANALSAFQVKIGKKINSPFDRYLRGEKGVLTRQQKKGMKLFYGKAGCGDCHSGPLQTDHKFYAIALPQIGPGNGDGPHGYEDYGYARTTFDPKDRYKFRTPTLRNLSVTAPYGHDGAYGSLEDMVRHHLNPVESLKNYTIDKAILPYREDLSARDKLALMDMDVQNALIAANELEPVELSDKEFKHLMAFLRALDDPSIYDIRLDFPKRVPSGLPIFD